MLQSKGKETTLLGVLSHLLGLFTNKSVETFFGPVAKNHMVSKWKSSGKVKNQILISQSIQRLP